MKILSIFLFLSLLIFPSEKGFSQDASSMVGGMKGGDLETTNIGTGSGFGYYPQSKRQQQQSEKPQKLKKNKKNSRLK